MCLNVFDFGLNVNIFDRSAFAETKKIKRGTVQCEVCFTLAAHGEDQFSYIDCLKSQNWIWLPQTDTSECFTLNGHVELGGTFVDPCNKD